MVLECQSLRFRLRGVVVVVVVVNKKYFGLKCDPTLKAYISAFRGPIFNFKTVLESILGP